MPNSTLTPQYLTLGLETKLEFYQTATNFLDTFSSFTKELSLAIDWDLAKHVGSPIKATFEFYDKLNKTDAQQLTDNQLLFWVEQFHRQSEQLKQIVLDNLTSDNVIYQPFSESLGYIARPESVADSFTLPFYDENVQIIPVDIDSTTFTKMNPKALLMYMRMSRLTASVLRTNIKHIQDPQVEQGENVTSNDSPTYAFQAHGFNLVTDVKHWYRIKKISVEVTKKLQQTFKHLYPVIKFLIKYNPQDNGLQKIGEKEIGYNYEEAIKSGYKHTIEGQEQTLDFLQRKIHSQIKEVSTFNILGT